MLDLLRQWIAFKFDRRGVTALEYALIAGVLGALIVGGFSSFGTSLKGVMTTIIGEA